MQLLKQESFIYIHVILLIPGVQKMSETQIVQMLLRGQDDLSWFDSNLDSLKNKYNNKFIAFQSRKVIDFDSNLDSLMAKLKSKGTDTSNIFVKFVSKVKTLL